MNFSLVRLLLSTSALLLSIGYQINATEVGPDSGTLLIVGGGARGAMMFEKFIELAGGKDAPLVYITTANPGMSAAQREERGNRLRSLGATDVTVMHTLDREVADSDAFAAPLKRAMGVWFGLLPMGMNVILIAFEFLIAYLQAYVFTILCCIYLKDAIDLH